MRLPSPSRRHAAPRAAQSRLAPPIPARVWLASAACEAAVALGAVGALFATHASLFR